MIRIGITPFFRYGAAMELYVPEQVVQSLLDAGANPVILPLLPDEAGAEEWLGQLDGLFVTGNSHAIDANLYGEENTADMLYGICPHKHAEIGLIRAAIACRMPVMGVCGGHQALNVAQGGTMVQNIGATFHNNALKHNYSEDGTPLWYPVHRVFLSDYAKDLLGDIIMTNSTHDDAIGRVGDGLVIAGKTSDGVCEILISEDMEQQYLLGTQFHPEQMRGALRDTLFSDFVAAARRYAGSQ